MILSTESHIDILNYIRCLCKKIQTFQASNFEESRKLFENTLKKLEEPANLSLNTGKEYSYHIRKIALTHFRTVNYKEAEYYTGLLFNSAPQDNYIETDPYILSANVNSVKEASEYNKDAYKLSRGFNNLDANAISYNNLGNIFLYKNNYEEALSYFQKAAAIFSNKNLNRLKSSVLQNITLINLHLKNYTEALNSINESIKLRKLFDDLEGIAFCAYLKGKIYFESRNFQDAIKNLQKAFKILSHTDDKIGLISCNLLNARIYIKNSADHAKNKSLKEAKKSLRAAEDFANLAIKNNEAEKSLLVFIYKVYIDLYEAKGNFEKVNKYLLKCSKMEIQIHDENISSAVAEYHTEADRAWSKFTCEAEKLYSHEFSEIEKIIKNNEKEKNDVLGSIIHDLKNPIGNIKQLVEYLINGSDLNDEEKNDFKMLILESAETSLGFITKLLDSTAIEQNAVMPKSDTIDINEEIIKLIKFYKVQAGNKSIDVIFENKYTEKFFNTDKDAFLNILDNLFSNAIKFSPKNKSIYITLSKDNGYLKTEIKDEGPGFSEEDREKLFKQFSKLSARPTGGEHSSGLGLSIVKKLVDSLNGTIECESEKGKGANMVVRIPIS
jgi:nitrogen-specific signal transduction histidine kinase